MLLALILATALLAGCEIVKWEGLGGQTTTAPQDTSAKPDDSTQPTETTTKKPWTPNKPGSNKPEEEETTTEAPSEEVEFPQLPI